MMALTTIPYEAYGGQGPWLHFAHANAYPPACYRQLLMLLADRFRVVAVHHRPLWPGSRPDEIESWQDIAGDLLTFLEQQELNQVIGVGHSLGGVATMMAALRRPHLFSKLILIEPVFLPPPILALFAGRPDGSAPGGLPLVETALRRRNHWHNREEAFAHFRQKDVFACWSDEALWDYVTYGLREDQTGDLKLSYPPSWEARIYALPPTRVWQLIPQITQPTLGIRGGKTDTISLAAWELWQASQPDADFVEVSGCGHLLTMERPQEVAAIITRFLEGGATNGS